MSQSTETYKIETFQVINHSKRMLQEYLNGNHEAINFAFTWTDTAFGRNHKWSELYYKTRTATEEELSYLRWLLKSKESPNKLPTAYYDYRVYDITLAPCERSTL